MSHTCSVNLIRITVFNPQIITNGPNVPVMETEMGKFRGLKPPGQEKQDLNKLFYHDLFYAAIC